MVEWVAVIGLIMLGLVIILVEIVFVPGTTVVGILGFLSAGYGVFLGYEYFGTTTGSIVLVTSAVFGFIVTFYALKSKAWERFSLKQENNSKVNEGVFEDLIIGTEGITVSALRPVGKASFHDRELEVRSNGSYIAESILVRIIKIESDRIIVEPINS